MYHARFMVGTFLPKLNCFSSFLSERSIRIIIIIFTTPETLLAVLLALELFYSVIPLFWSLCGKVCAYMKIKVFFHSHEAGEKK